MIAGLPELSAQKVGVLHLFIQHTSAALTINENTAADVRADLEMALNRIVPDSWPYKHDEEGADDMPAHVKASLLGSSVSIPITNGKLALGTWQGIYLAEFRDKAPARMLVATIQGESFNC